MTKLNFSPIVTGFSILLFVTPSNIIAQQDGYAAAMKLKTESNYKDALPAFKALLKSDSNNVNYLAQGSQVYTRYGYLHVEKEKEKQEYYKTGEYLARKAIAVDERNAQGHFAYCLALGRINEKADNKKKISSAKLIKTEIDRTIQLDPKIPNSYHILGRWHTVIAGFSKGQKKFIDRFYGGVPVGASYDEAIKAYNNAIALDPTSVIHYFEMGQTYYDMGNKSESKSWLEKATKMTVVTDEDRINMDKSKKLLKKVS